MESYQDYLDSLEATAILEDLGYPDMQSVMRSALVGTLFLAGTVGASVMLVYSYFFIQPKRDSVIARLGVLWLLLMNAGLCALWLYQNDRMLAWSERFTADHLRDFWLSELEGLLFTMVEYPITLFFCNRAYWVCDRNRWILALCVTSATVSFVMGFVAGIKGLVAPWGMEDLSNEQYIYWITTLSERFDELWPFTIADAATSVATTCLVSICITYGIFRHRSGSVELNDAISRIIYVCSESLAPMVILDAVNLGAEIYKTPVAILILRVVTPLGIPTFYYCLMLSLISRQRVSDILKANPVRNVAEFTQPLSDLEKQDSSDLKHSETPFADNRHSNVYNLTEISEPTGMRTPPILTTSFGTTHSSFGEVSGPSLMREQLSLNTQTPVTPPISPQAIRFPVAAHMQNMQKRRPQSSPSGLHSAASALGFGKTDEEEDPYAMYSPTGRHSVDNWKEETRRRSDSLGLFDVLARGPDNC